MARQAFIQQKKMQFAEFTCKMPQNKIETIPVNPRVSANKNELHESKKNNPVSRVSMPSNRKN